MKFSFCLNGLFTCIGRLMYISPPFLVPPGFFYFYNPSNLGGSKLRLLAYLCHPLHRYAIYSPLRRKEESIIRRLWLTPRRLFYFLLKFILVVSNLSSMKSWIISMVLGIIWSLIDFRSTALNFDKTKSASSIRSRKSEYMPILIRL